MTQDKVFRGINLFTAAVMLFNGVNTANSYTESIGDESMLLSIFLGIVSVVWFGSAIFLIKYVLPKEKD